MKLSKEQKQQIRKIIDEIAFDETIEDGKTAIKIKLHEVGLSYENPRVAREIFINIRRLKKQERKERYKK